MLTHAHALSDAASPTRRSFIAGGAALGAGIALSAATAANAAETKDGSSSAKDAPSTSAAADADATLPSFLAAPDPIPASAIAQTLECDVCVVGLGVAGVAAARAAAEGGLSVIALEKCSVPSCRSSQYACFNTDNARAMGIADVDTNELVNELMTQTGHRADARVLKNWADHCGEAFDWWANGYDGILWQVPGGEKYDRETQVFVSNGNAYEPYQYQRDHEHVVCGTLSFRSPDKAAGQGPIVTANWEKAQAAGAQGIFDTPARQLVKDGDAVVGVIAQSLADESYLQVNARKGVILATGGYVRNDEMLAYYIPWVYNNKDKFTFTYPHMDITGAYADQGDGQRMGFWAGGHIEEGPHCAMCHGDLGKLGVDAFLQLNANGERYINEDLTNDHFGSAILRQPGALIYQIFDANFPEQVGAMQAGLGTRQSVSQDDIDSVNDWTTAHGDTIDELIENLGVDEKVAATMKQQIERYNELAEKGVDEDFGKDASRMFALTTPPFYAIRYQVGAKTEDSASQNALRCLVTMSGLSTNKDAQVLAQGTLQPIEGLYAIGNTQGGRFLGDYPATIAGASHSIAMTYGYLTGRLLAEK
ncbi:FAD-binding protein [bacterium]|nr:FAD-binding protein [bacterium]